MIYISENTLKGPNWHFITQDQLCILPQSCQRRRQDDTLCGNIEKDCKMYRCLDVSQGTVEVAHFISNSISWGQKQTAHLLRYKHWQRYDPMGLIEKNVCCSVNIFVGPQVIPLKGYFCSTDVVAPGFLSQWHRTLKLPNLSFLSRLVTYFENLNIL